MTLPDDSFSSVFADALKGKHCAVVGICFGPSACRTTSNRCSG